MIDPIENAKLRERYNPDGSLLRRHQLKMLEMLKYVDQICKQNNIKYWLSSGTLLGAVRHGGFIPWDDDLDIEMLRRDYEKFVRVMAEEDSFQYFFQTHQTDSNYFAPYGKLRDLTSRIKEDNSNDMYYKYQGIYIDVFIMEPSSSLFIHKSSNLLQEFLLYRMNKHIRNKRFRILYFSTIYFLLHKMLFPILRCLSKCGAKGRLRHAMGSCFVKSRNLNDIFPLRQMSFEGYLCFVPNNVDAYLRNIYGNYMELPNIENVKVHTLNVEFHE